VRSMLGSVDLKFVYQLLEAIAEGDPAELLKVVSHMGEHAPDYEGGLDELLSLIHRVALAQVVPDAIDNSWGDAQRVGELAAAIAAEDAQLFYQIALNGKRDIGLAPDPRGGFEMILLRMLAFRPAAVIDESLGSEDLSPVAAVQHNNAAGEVGAQVKKSREVPLKPLPDTEPAIVAAPIPEPVAAAPVIAKTAAAVSAGSFALSDLTTSSWPHLLELLGLVGIVYNIASHCELDSKEQNDLGFVLDSANASLFNDSHSAKIRLALENYFGHSLSVSIVPGEVGSETPAMGKARVARERQEEAVVSIESDPQLQALIVRFDGELDRSSIVPTDL